MDQNQQGDASPASNSTADFNNDRANNQVERRQLAYVPDVDEILASFQNHEGDGLPASNSTAVFNNDRANNQPERWQPPQVSGANENINNYNWQMVTNPQPHMAYPIYPNSQINSQMIAANHAQQNRQYREILLIPAVQIQQAPLTSRQPLLGKRIFNNQGQQFFRVPNQPYNLVAASNSNVYHSTAAPRFINAGLYQNNVYQFQARGTPANPTHYNFGRYPGVTANNSNIINENNVSQCTSSFVPPGQSNSNSSSRLHINENTNNEVMELPNLSTKTPLPRVNTEVSKNINAELPSASAEMLDSMNPATKVNTKNNAKKRKEASFPTKPRKLTKSKFPIIEEASSLQSDIATSSNVSESNVDTIFILEQNEPLNQSPAEKGTLPKKHKKNETKRKKQNYTPVIKESSSNLIPQRKRRNATKAISYTEHSQDSESSDDYSMNEKAEAIPNSPKDVTTNNVRPAVPQNMNTLVTENKECEKSTYQGEYIKFLRQRVECLLTIVCHFKFLTRSLVSHFNLRGTTVR